MSQRARVVGLLALGGLSLAGCSATTTPLAPIGGRPAYQISCAEVGDCWAQANRACSGSYRTLERHDNWISESELPGLNERTDEHNYRRWTLETPATRSPQPYGPSNDSDRALPLTDVVVLCTGS